MCAEQCCKYSIPFLTETITSWQEDSGNIKIQILALHTKSKNERRTDSLSDTQGHDD